MDALALLCNLYGDGPATLQRLRAAGRGSLDSLERSTVEELTLLLSCEPAGAVRFQREARRLRERIENAAESADGGAASAEEQDEELMTESLSERLIEKTLVAWRARDEEDRDRPAGPTFAAPAPLAEAAIDSRKPVSAPAAGTSLETLLELDARSGAALREQGLETLEALADLGPSELEALAARSRLPLTRCIRLQFLARRRLAASAPSPIDMPSSIGPSSSGPSSSGVEECEIILMPAPPAASVRPAAGPGSVPAVERTAAPKPSSLPIPGPGCAAALAQDHSAVPSFVPDPVQIAIAPVHEARFHEPRHGTPTTQEFLRAQHNAARFSPSERPAEFSTAGLELEGESVRAPVRSSSLPSPSPTMPSTRTAGPSIRTAGLRERPLPSEESAGGPFV
jgi:hypothetical protein